MLDAAREMLHCEGIMQKLIQVLHGNTTNNYVYNPFYVRVNGDHRGVFFSPFNYMNSPIIPIVQLFKVI